MDTFLKHSAVTGLRRMFLLVSPNETSFEKLEDVPNYVDEAVPYFVVLIVLEWLILLYKGKNVPRLNDSFSSLSNGLISQLHNLLFRSTELAMFIWVHENYNIVTFPWNNPWTWVLSLLAIDFAYYWVHRTGHEVNIVWSGHQTHHSSEEYNLSTALRQSALQPYFSWIFYMPLGLFLPPSIFLVHIQFNLLYQFWIHTETIDKLGPLEWVLSTPSHHRVHHGRNPYCIDKNYGGILIVWDRLFGTFEAEKKEEKVVYGLVHNIDSWEPLYAQLCHLIYIIKTAWQMEGFSNKVYVIVKGPGWSPGKPRLGLIEDIPQVEQNPNKYDRSVPLWNSLYIFLHFIIFLLVWIPTLAMHKESLSSIYMVVNIVFIVFSLHVFGSMYDNRPYSDLLELARCVCYVILTQVYNSPVGAAVFWIYLVSASWWTMIVLQRRLATSNPNRKME